MQAIVLVGGEGTRLRPLTYGTPKPMVPIAGVPFLARTLERLSQAGIRDVILPAGYMPEQISDYFGDGSRLGMSITYVIEATPLGTAGALKNVEQYIAGPFFVLNGDVLTSLDLRAMMAEHERKGGIGLLHLIRVEDPSAFGCVVHDRDGRISAFVEKPPRESAPTNEINAGTYLFEREILDLIPAGRNVSIERETFPQIIAAGKGLYAYTTDDYWIDLGKPEQYLGAHRDVLARRMPMLRLEPGVSGEGAPALANVSKLHLPVHADRGVRVDPSAEIGPNAVIGEQTFIGASAIVRDSVLWDRVIIEEGASVDGAIVASGARIGRGARVEPGSVIGHDTIVGPGEVLERGSRVGASAPITR
ncbi:MAG TPA: NDP-sugar synthase [Candidatus Baltobacteraceae bacterium]|nr:NDP-sugar synthase [Candidatus Baltobacteraceae bacterium]